jgi:hypothetical protein
MRTSQGSGLQSLRAVQAFLDANAAVLGTIPTSGARKRLDDIVTALDAHADTQSGSSLAAKGATQKQYALRLTLLRDHMAPIAKIAAAELPDTPEMQPLRMPRGRPSAERLKALAYGMATAATPWADTFVNAGLPEDFIAQLTAAADAMLGTVGDRRQSRATRAAATKGLKTLLSKGRKVVHVLDAMVKRALAKDAPRLTAWNTAKRVQLVPGGGQTAPAPQPPAAPAGSAPAPASSPATA